MKRPFLIDVHDRDLTPIIYTLLFALVEINGNDMSYDINPFDWEGSDEWSKKAWEERLSRGRGNCYHDDEAMKNMLANPPTVEEAIKHFQDWLRKHGVTEKDDVMAKIWW